MGGIMRHMSCNVECFYDLSKNIWLVPMKLQFVFISLSGFEVNF